MTRWPRPLAAIAGVAALAIIIIGFLVINTSGGDDDGDNGDVIAVPTPAATVGKLSIISPWVRTTTNDVSAAYFTVKNTGDADTLVSVKSSITMMAQLHEVVTEGASSKMQEKPGGFPVPANGDLTLAPGGYHVMMMNLKAPLNEGDTVDLELTFKNAGVVKLTAPVKAGDAASPGMHGMGN